MVANKATAGEDLHELIAWLKANPDKVTIGNAGPGSAIAPRRSLFPDR